MPDSTHPNVLLQRLAQRSLITSLATGVEVQDPGENAFTFQLIKHILRPFMAPTEGLEITSGWHLSSNSSSIK
ncbi:hypothetical protein EYR38_006573 [Pleurotus pulmonarius]|nr:hypothetical protein EYR38_006573 [Pleurotus pulmonarius]